MSDNNTLKTVQFGVETFDLELCARCGGNPEICLNKDQQSKSFHVYCIGCFHESFVHQPTPVAAVAYWNEMQQEHRKLSLRASFLDAVDVPLKPCPFCGSEPTLLYLVGFEEEGVIIRCRCNANGTCAETVSLSSPYEAAKSWNTRKKPRFSILAYLKKYFIG